MAEQTWGEATNTGTDKHNYMVVNDDGSINMNIRDVGGIPAEVDNSTHSLQTIKYEHHEIHAGSHFNYCDYALGIASGATKRLVFTTPDTAKWGHLTFSFSASEGAILELFEGSTNVVGGTSVTPRNNNRNSTNASVMTLIVDPTSITVGTRVAGFLAGGAKTAGFDSRSKENVLKQNTTYLARITSLAVSNDISWCAEWYEHEDKN